VLSDKFQRTILVKQQCVRPISLAAPLVPDMHETANPVTSETKAPQVLSFFGAGSPYLRTGWHMRVRAEVVLTLAGKNHYGRVLDLGCGDGSISRSFLGHGNHITLLDFSAAMLERAAAHIPHECLPESEFIQANLLEHRFTSQYDLVLCVGVLAHVDDVLQTLNLISRLTRTGGRCIIQLSDRGQWSTKLVLLWEALANLALRRRTYRKNHTGWNTMRRMAEARGLQLREYYRYSLLLPGMGFLPDTLLYKWQKFTFRHPIIGCLGTELIASFDKPVARNVSEKTVIP
jgi:ubiquinone/menaquinone biosynthesis C-methylase UbiE